MKNPSNPGQKTRLVGKKVRNDFDFGPENRLLRVPAWGFYGFASENDIARHSYESFGKSINTGAASASKDAALLITLEEHPLGIP